MNKKLAASLTIAIFLLSTIAILAPVQAHFTLGNSTEGVYPYTANDFDPHVKGVIGYVWPGGGENTYLGSPTGVTNVVGPGYVPPYPNPSIAKDLALGGAQGWTQNLAQLDGHEYAPFGAIVVGSTGDLIFAINATQFADSWDNFYIAIPPEFTIPNAEQVVTTITNNYANIEVYQTVNQYDRYIPGWHLVRIITDPGHLISFTPAGEWYYVRINGVTAPSTAGKYFFKMYLYNSASPPTTSLHVSCDVPFIADSCWVPTQNWPVLLVKGELDPAIITGTILYGGYNSSLYGKPVELAGKVWAQMTTKFDPYTGKSVVDCTKASKPTLVGCADAVGYFNETADGHYEVEGVAPGIYNLYAEAAGYPLALIATNVQVLKGQSLHFDGYLNPGPVIHGDVFSKHSFGSEPWPYNSYVKIELYDKPTVNHVPSSNSTLVSWSPLPCVAGGQAGYNAGEDAAACNDPRSPSNLISFPWNDWPGNAGGVFQGGAQSTDPQGVGPAQTWYVKQNEDKFHYEFGAKGMFGAPRDLDGHVPQRYATWVNGLTAGRYYARAWVFRYVQSALDGSTFQEYSFQVTPNEWAGDISIPIDLRISSWINKTVHFHDNAGTLSTSAISTGAEVLVGTLTDAKSGILYSYNQTLLQSVYGMTPSQRGNINYMIATGNSYVTFYGFNDTWLGQNYGIPAGTYKPKVQALGYLQQTQDLVSVTLSGTPIQISNHLYRGVGFNFTVYSIDWERPRVNRNWVWPLEDISIGVYDSKYKFVSDACWSCHLGYSGVVLPTFQFPTTYYANVLGTGVGNAQGVWFGVDAKYHYQGLLPIPALRATYVGGRMAEAVDPLGLFLNVGVFTVGSARNAWDLFTDPLLYPTAIDSGQYSFLGWTYGYVQNKDYTVYANKGQIADMKINLIIGVNVTLDILFKKEHLISRTPYDMSVRVRLFDDSGRLVATWMSSEGVYVTGTGRATAAYHRGVSSTDPFMFDGGLNSLPGGINLLHVTMAGLPTDPAAMARLHRYGDPVFTPDSGDFEVANWPADYWSVAKAHFPNAGILGSPDYTGGWTAEVDFVNRYLNDSSLTVANFDPIGTMVPNYYPVVPGLLMGESYHIIPGTQAKSKISYTEDGALDPYFLGHSMVANHLGPYSQQGVWTFTNAPLSGETSAIYEVDLNGYVSGTALAFTWSNEFRSISWYTVSVLGANNATFNTYTEDGIYEFYLVPGQYSMTISGPGYKSTPLGTISVTSGQSSAPGSGNNVSLPQSNIPVPEFSGIAVVALSALAASLCLLRRRRQ